jgi:hypothetical protein
VIRSYLYQGSSLALRLMLDKYLHGDSEWRSFLNSPLPTSLIRARLSIVANDEAGSSSFRLLEL